MIRFLILELIILSFLAIFFIVPNILGAPWVPMPMDDVRKMLSMAAVKPGDVVYDLGSGDGRIIVTAAKEFGAGSVGIEVNPLWVWWTRWRIGVLELGDRVEVIRGNFFRKDLSGADVVTLYLLPPTNIRLKQKLEMELKPGTRVVTHVYTFKGWRPVAADNESQLYLYRIGDHKDLT